MVNAQLYGYDSTTQEVGSFTPVTVTLDSVDTTKARLWTQVAGSVGLSTPYKLLDTPVTNKKSDEYLSAILNELRIMNIHLSKITDDVLDENDFNIQEEED